MTMTRDPDLDAAIKELAPAARRLRQLQRQIEQADEVKEYRNLAARRFELGELTETFNTRGEKLRLADDRALAGRALLLGTEEAVRLWERSRRRPSADRLYEALTVTGATQEKVRAEAAAEVVLAEYARKIAAHNAAATASLLRYLEQSR